MAASKDAPAEPPVFVQWEDPAGETHYFVRSDWVMDFLFAHLAREDAVRTWSKMHAERVRASEGSVAADEFLDVFGILEH